MTPIAASSPLMTADGKKAAMEAGAYDFVPRGEVALLREALERLTGLDRA